jgi:hypothetical protein
MEEEFLFGRQFEIVIDVQPAGMAEIFQAREAVAET